LIVILLLPKNEQKSTKKKKELAILKPKNINTKRPCSQNYISRGLSKESLKHYKYWLSKSTVGTRSHDSTEEPTDPVESISESACCSAMGGSFASAHASRLYIRCG
jgi:hypothetical protein